MSLFSCVQLECDHFCLMLHPTLFKVGDYDAATRQSCNEMVTGTQRPTTSTDKRKTKKMREAQENMLLEKAIECMEKVDTGCDNKGDDDDDLFGQ